MKRAHAAQGERRCRWQGVPIWRAVAQTCDGLRALWGGQRGRHPVRESRVVWSPGRVKCAASILARPRGGARPTVVLSRDARIGMCSVSVCIMLDITYKLLEYIDKSDRRRAPRTRAGVSSIIYPERDNLRRYRNQDTHSSQLCGACCTVRYSFSLLFTGYPDDLDSPFSSVR